LSGSVVRGLCGRRGFGVVFSGAEEHAGEPQGTINFSFGACESFSVGPDEVPLLIDEIPALAALAAMMPAGATFTVRGAGELRVKESDRISSLSQGFRAMGAGVEEYD